MVEALDGVREPDGASGEVLVIDDSSPDGTGGSRTSSRPSRPWLHVLHRPRKEGLGRAYLDGFRWALARDYELRARDGLRLLARSARRAVAARARARGRRPRAGLALLPGRAGRELGPRAAPDLDRRLPVCAHAARRRGARPDGRLQVLPPRRARGDRARCRRCAGLPVPDRDDLPGAAARLQRGRGADHVRRPRRRRIEDVALDRVRGDAARAAAAPPGCARAAAARRRRRPRATAARFI